MKDWYESPCPNFSAHMPHPVTGNGWCLGRHHSERGRHPLSANRRPVSKRPHDVYVYQKGLLWGWRCLSCGDAIDPTWRRRKEAEDTAGDHINDSAPSPTLTQPSRLGGQWVVNQVGSSECGACACGWITGVVDGRPGVAERLLNAHLASKHPDRPASGAAE